MGYWGTVAQRAFREALEQLRWTSPLRVAQSIAPTAAAGAVTWATTGTPAYAAAASVGALILVGAAWFVERIAHVPAAMDAELRAQIKKDGDARAAQEDARRKQFIDTLSYLYVKQEQIADPLGTEISLGLKLPPEEWLNRKLAEAGEEWFVCNVSGANYQTVEFLPVRSAKAS